MLKKWILSFLTIGFAAVVGFSAFANPGYAQHDPTAKGDWAPFPFGLQLKFPWNSIQGTWKVENPNFSAFLTLIPINRKNTDVRYLNVRLLDISTCQVIASGPGFESHDLVKAQFIYKPTGQAFNFTVGSFKREDIYGKTMTDPTRSVMVMSLNNLSENSYRNNFVISKVSSQVTEDCRIWAQP